VTREHVSDDKGGGKKGASGRRASRIANASQITPNPPLQGYAVVGNLAGDESYDREVWCLSQDQQEGKHNCFRYVRRGGRHCIVLRMDRRTEETLQQQPFPPEVHPTSEASFWSQRNVDKVATLVAAGRMQPAGQTELDTGKADGRWEKAYAGSRTIGVPKDFEEALSQNKKAKDFFETPGKTKRFSFLMRIGTAKRAETRKNRIDEYVALLAQQKTL